MKIGQMIMTDKVTHRGFSSKDGKNLIRHPAGALGVYMYMGNITPDSVAHYNAEGVLAAMGYGPIQTTIAQRKVVEALKAAQEQVMHPDDEGKEGVLSQIEEALQLADNHYAASTEIAGAIMVDAARFDKLRRIVAGKIGGIDMLYQLLGAPDIGTQDRGSAGAIDAIIDAAKIP